MSYGAARKTTAAATVLLLTLFATGCTLKQDTHYRVTFGQDVEMTLYKNPTNQVTGLFLFCERQTNNQHPGSCTLDFLKAHVSLSGWGAAQWDTALHQYGDFDDAMGWPQNDRGILSSYYHDGGSSNINNLKCLAISYNYVFNSVNWTTKSRTDSNCQVGKPLS